MRMVLRHFLAIVALPVVVTIVVPVWIGRRCAVKISLPGNLAEVLLVILGLGLLLAGLLLFLACLRHFSTEGRGTLAPWDPPRHLVVRGPYRFVRNPMISGVIFILAGEALALRSLACGLWAAAFLATNLVYIPLFEEPPLEARFGDEYRRYKKQVPRFLPRLRPWRWENDTSN